MDLNKSTILLYCCQVSLHLLSVQSLQICYLSSLSGFTICLVSLDSLSVQSLWIYYLSGLSRFSIWCQYFNQGSPAGGQCTNICTLCLLHCMYSVQYIAAQKVCSTVFKYNYLSYLYDVQFSRYWLQRIIHRLRKIQSDHQSHPF